MGSETFIRILHGTLASPKPEVIQGFEYYSGQQQIKFRASLKSEETLIEETLANDVIRKLRIRHICNPPPNILVNDQRYVNTVTGIEISWPIDPKWVFSFISYFKVIKFLKFGSTAFNQFVQSKEDFDCYQCLTLEELIISSDPKRFKRYPTADSNSIIKPNELVQAVNKILLLASAYCRNMTTAIFTLPCDTNLKEFLDRMPQIKENGKEDLIYRENYVTFTSQIIAQPASTTPPPQLTHQHLKVNQDPAAARMSPPPASTAQKRSNSNSTIINEDETKQKHLNLIHPLYQELRSDEENNPGNAIINCSINNKQTIRIPGLEPRSDKENEEEEERNGRIEETDKEDQPLVIDEGDEIMAKGSKSVCTAELEEMPWSPSIIPLETETKIQAHSMTLRISFPSGQAAQKIRNSDSAETKQKHLNLIHPLYQELRSDEEMTDGENSPFDAIFNCSSINKQTIGIPGLEPYSDQENEEDEERNGRIEETDKEDQPLVIDEGVKEDENVIGSKPLCTPELEEMPWSPSIIPSSTPDALKINLTVPHAMQFVNSPVISQNSIKAEVNIRNLKEENCQPKKKKAKIFDYENDFDSCFTRRKKKK